MPTRRAVWRTFVGGLIALAWWLTMAPTQLGGPVTIAVVSGVSMQPTLNDGDLVLAYRQPSYAIGDTVIFDKLGGIVIHEIYAEVAPAAGPVNAVDGPIFKTRGINNQNPDSWRVHPSDIRGKWVFTLAGAGKLVIAFVSNPLLAGSVATALAAFVLLPRPRRRPSARLAELLAHSATERRRIKQSLAIEFTWLAIMALATFLASALLLVRHVPLWPQLGLSLVALLVAVGLLAWFWLYFGSGANLPEPNRSIAMLGPVLYRIDASITVDARPVASAKELSSIRDRTGLPVLHQIVNLRNDENAGMISATHKFFVVTAKEAFSWSVDVVQLKENHE